MRRLLDYLFKFSAFLAAAFLVIIALLILAQSLGRLVGIAVHDANELAGFSLAAGTFLALGPALRAGTHIRVMIVLSHLQGGVRRLVEVITLLAAIYLAGYFAWWMAVLAEESFSYGDASPAFWPFRFGYRKPPWPLVLLSLPSPCLKHLLTCWLVANPHSSAAKQTN